MNLKELFNYLQDALQQSGSGTVTLDDKAANAAFKPLLGCLYCSSWVIGGCVLTLKSDAVAMNGEASFPHLINSRKFSVELDIQEDKKDGFSYVLNASMPYSGGFLDFFTYLYPMRLVDGSYYQTVESELRYLNIENPCIYLDTRNSRKTFPFVLSCSVKFTENGRWKPFAYLFANPGQAVGGMAFYSYGVSFQLKVPLNTTIPVTHALTDNGSFIRDGAVYLYLANGVSMAGSADEELLSSASLGIEILFNGVENPVEFASGLFGIDKYISLFVGFRDGFGAADLLNFFASLFNMGGNAGSDLLLPSGCGLNNFRLYSLVFGMMKSDDGKSLTLNDVSAKLSTQRPWVLPLEFITLNDLSLSWTIQWGQESHGTKPYFLTGVVKGSLDVRLPSKNIISMWFSAQLPELLISAHYYILDDKAAALTLKDAMGDDASQNTPAPSAVLASLDAYADYQNRNLMIYAQINDIMSFKLGNLSISLAEIFAGAEFTQQGNSYFLGGQIAFGEAGDDGYFLITLKGGYSDETWLFEGGIKEGYVDIGSVIKKILEIDSGTGINFAIMLTDFHIRYSYKKSRAVNPFSFRAKFSADFDLSCLIPNLEVRAGGAVAVETKESGDNFMSVLVSLDVGIFGIAMQVDDYGTDKPSFLFQFHYKDHYLLASYAVKNNQQILTVNMENVTLGDVISFFIDLINGNNTSKMPAPWDVLYNIDLSRFIFKYSFTDRTMELSYRLDLNIVGILKVKTVGLRYIPVKEGAPEKLLMILDTDSADNNDLSWDLLTEKPPLKLNEELAFSLSYLGLAQHFTDREGKLKNASSISDAMECLLNKDTVFVYDSASNWMFAADFTVNSALHCQFLLLDPVIYGIKIVVVGDKAPFDAFNGLEVELFYKKISSDIGMFKAIVILPIRFRKLNLGYITVGIGRMSLEIYTNGNFLLDLGFPHDMDFSHSFTFEFGIYSGVGGLYFGSLSGAVTSRVPQVKGGHYAPVVAVGIGLSVGIGRSFDFGVAAAGVSIQVFGIFEGLFAVFNEDATLPANSTGGGTYYYAQATLGISGRLYVKADLKIITISASAEIFCYAKAVLETAKPVYVDLDLYLKLQAKIKILFVKVSFSYTFHEHVQFVIGNEGSNYMLSFKSGFLPVSAPLGKWEMELSVVPQFSMYADAEGAYKYCTGFISVMRKADFVSFADMMSRWLVSSLSGEGLTRSGAKAFTADLLTDELTYEKISGFLNENAVFKLTHADYKTAYEEETDGAVFPVPPPLHLEFSEKDSKVLADISYWSDNLVDAGYAERIKEYFKQFDTEHSADLNRGFAGDAQYPLAEIVFTDYFTMVMRQLMKTVRAMYVRYVISADSIKESAAKYKITVADILRMNMGINLTATGITFKNLTVTADKGSSFKSIADSMHVDAVSVFISNEDKASILRQGTIIPVGEYVYGNENGLTLELVAALFFVRWYGTLLNGYYQKYVENVYSAILAAYPDASIDWEYKDGQEAVLALPENISWKVQPGDTVERLAGICALSAANESLPSDWAVFYESVKNLNPDVTGSLKVAELKDMSITVGGDSTPGSLMRRLFPDRWGDIKDDNILLTLNILAVFASVEVPEALLTPSDDDTVSTFMNRYFLSFDELGEAVNDDNIKSGQQITVQPEYIPDDELLSRLNSDDCVQAIMSLVSRFMLQGLRLPEVKPDNDENSTEAFYDIMMQQVPYDDDGVSCVLKLNSGQTGQQWLTGSIETDMASQTIKSRLPDTDFDWTGRTASEPLALFSRVPKYYPVKESVLLNTQGQNRVIHFFSDQLTADFNNGLINSLGMRFENTGTEISFNTCVAVPFEIALAENTAGIYSVAGADASNRLILEKLINITEKLKYRLLYCPSPLDGMPDTLIDMQCGASDRLIKTNLSRETNMFPVMSVTDAQQDYTAALDDPAFFRLLWECSVVGGGGYKLILSDGKALPDNIFDEHGRALLWLAVDNDDKNTLKGKGINCASSEQTAGYRKAITFYEKDTSATGAFCWQPSLNPGCYGTLISVTPEAEGDDVVSTAELFSIFGYRVSLEYPDKTVEIQKDSKPLVPLQNADAETGSLEYAPVIPVYQLMDQVDYGPYSALELKKVLLSFYCRDILGNNAKGDVASEIVPEYNDFVIGVHEWPDVKIAYQVAAPAGTPQLTIKVSFTESENTGDSLISRLELSIYQLKRPDMKFSVQSSLLQETYAADKDKLIQFAQALLNHLQNKDNPAPEPLNIVCGAFSGTEDMFAVNAELVLTRLDFVKDIISAKRGGSPVKPDISAGSCDGGLTAAEFAENFEKAIPELKLAYAGGEKGDLYAIRVASGKLLNKITVAPYEGGSPYYYCLCPLSSVPVTRYVEVSDLNTPTEKTSCLFSDIDIEVWVRKFLDDFEYLLSDENIALVSRCDESDIANVISQKEALAEKISSQLIRIDTGEKPPVEVVRLVHNRLLKSLVIGYDISCIAQYSMTAQESGNIRLTTVLKGKEDKKTEGVKSSKIDTGANTFCLIYPANSPFISGIDPDFTGISVYELEYGIQDVYNGYESSKWLRFILPIDGKKGGSVLDINLDSAIPAPNPLRFSPVSPELSGQTYLFPDEQQNFPGWQYRLVCRSSAVEQDTLHFSITFNDAESGLMAEEEDLFDALAKYMYVRDALMKQIKDGNVSAVASFAAMAQDISTHWEKGVSVCRLSLQDASDVLNCQVNINLEELKLTVACDDPSRGVKAEFVTPADEIVQGELFSFALYVNSLNLYRQNSVTPSVQTVRNQDILKPLTVCSRFIYKTEVESLNKMFVKHASAKSILLGEVSGSWDAAGVLSVMDMMMEKLGISDVYYPADIAVWYSYLPEYSNITDDVELPVIIYKGLPCNTLNQQDIVSFVVNWVTDLGVSQNKSGLVFDIKVYTNDFSRVLLSLSHAAVTLCNGSKS